MKIIQKSLVQQSDNPDAFLFNSIVFGPVISRRLGVSLGINLLPINRKACTFNCIYCECGKTPDDIGNSILPTHDEVTKEIEKIFFDLRLSNQSIDTITFAGNGEPTLHPHFPQIVDKLIVLRKKYFPAARIAVLTNATRLQKPGIINALSLVDDAILKLDSAIQETAEKINCPNETFNIESVIETASQMSGKCVIQTMFIRATVDGNSIDNTTDEEVTRWLEALNKIKPRLVQIYSLSRIPTINTVEKVDAETLQNIAAKVQQLGIETLVTP
ncbi:MAG TPA: radical SAM protein [Salinivirgaceae bacterium]|nr:radical SAM protein [Salinivirgaceae bacterium]